jgi:hypothetical protein
VTAILWVLLKLVVFSVVSSISPAILYVVAFCPSVKFFTHKPD